MIRDAWDGWGPDLFVLRTGMKNGELGDSAANPGDVAARPYYLGRGSSHGAESRPEGLQKSPF